MAPLPREQVGLAAPCRRPSPRLPLLVGRARERSEGGSREPAGPRRPVPRSARGPQGEVPAH
jgi:hypothetical protein